MAAERDPEALIKREEEEVVCESRASLNSHNFTESFKGDL